MLDFLLTLALIETVQNLLSLGFFFFGLWSHKAIESSVGPVISQQPSLALECSTNTELFRVLTQTVNRPTTSNETALAFGFYSCK